MPRSRACAVLPLLPLLLCLVLALPVHADERVILHTDSPDFFGQATTDGVPADFLSARTVSARMVQYNRPLVDMLSELDGTVTYRALRNGHALQHEFYSHDQGSMLNVEYRLIFHAATKEAEITDILVNGRLLDNYDFYDYADELGRPKRP